MNRLVRLVLPVLLGVVAGGLNYYALSRGTTPKTFVRVTSPLASGDVFDESVLEEFPLPDTGGSLDKTAVPFDDHSALLNRPTSRELKAGDLVLWSDVSSPFELAAGPDEMGLPISLEGMSVVPELLLVGDKIRFLLPTAPPSPQMDVAGSASPRTVQPPPRTVEEIGPFRILSVGSRVSRRDGPITPASVANGDVITVAIQREGAGDKPLDAASRRLVEVLSQKNLGGPALMIAILPTDRPARPTPEAEAEAKTSPQDVSPDGG